MCIYIVCIYIEEKHKKIQIPFRHILESINRSSNSPIHPHQYKKMTNVSLLLCCTILSFGIVVNGSTYINGEEVGFYEIKTGNFSVKLTNWGASLVSVVVPDKYGVLKDNTHQF